LQADCPKTRIEKRWKDIPMGYSRGTFEPDMKEELPSFFAALSVAERKRSDAQAT